MIEPSGDYGLRPYQGSERRTINEELELRNSNSSSSPFFSSSRFLKGWMMENPKRLLCKFNG